MDRAFISLQLKHLVDETLTYIHELEGKEQAIPLKKETFARALPKEEKIAAEPPKKLLVSHEPEKQAPVALNRPIIQTKNIPQPQKKPARELPVDPLSDLFSFFKKSASMLLAQGPIPSDYLAKKIKEGWKNNLVFAQVVILAWDESAQQFLEQVAKAIQSHFRPCIMIPIAQFEKEKAYQHFLENENLKLVISPDVDLWNSKQLMSLYHEIPQKKERYLGKKPLLLIPDIKLYFKDPSLKRSLWTQLCQVMKTL